MDLAANKEIITFVVFLSAFIVYIASSFGIGKAESDGDVAAKSFAFSGLGASIIAMLISWFATFGTKTPKNFLETLSGKTFGRPIYLTLMYLIPVVLGMVTLSASSYGLGKHDKNRDSQEYTASLAFFAIGLSISIMSLASWGVGNSMADRFTPVLESKEEVKTEATTALNELGDCKKENITDEISKRVKNVEDK